MLYKKDAMAIVAVPLFFRVTASNTGEALKYKISSTPNGSYGPSHHERVKKQKEDDAPDF